MWDHIRPTVSDPTAVLNTQNDAPIAPKTTGQFHATARTAREPKISESGVRDTLTAANTAQWIWHPKSGQYIKSKALAAQEELDAKIRQDRIDRQNRRYEQTIREMLAEQAAIMKTRGF